MALNQVFNGESKIQVLELLKEYNGKAKLIAGGTDVIIALRNNKISPKVLIDISKIEELRRIESKDNKITIGSAVTYTQIVENNLFDSNLYGFKKACRLVGSPQIRNKGTIGGNIANASPAADSIPPLIALGAKLNISSSTGERKLLLEDYFNDMKGNTLKADELLVSIEFEIPKKNQILGFSKLGLRKALAISRVTLSSLIGIDEDINIESIRVASGSIGKYPMREKEVEEALIGKRFNSEILKVAVNSLQASMDTRLVGRSTLPYKRKAVITLLEEVYKDNLSYFNEVTL
ncbi:FAD binding domain-containing protein [Tissierella sp. Yu-01]|uniref:FAD binding domain-containing protein n=1 Tax=Tissierella sp. Yu-01 TaxID=3035694 RepID=UPI00240D4D52|nr:FAD binding domain-containing protein [Tissierella sp. Yu-01]WFA07834.1 FAD binding domain-containing protein [Tissierella sp. Yu-01]